MDKSIRDSYYEFGFFRLKPTEQRLEGKGTEIKLHKQWYDILLILVRCRGRELSSKVGYGRMK
jgi:DNA-binding winged helix-turn-helix (wHTH) protein